MTKKIRTVKESTLKLVIGLTLCLFSVVLVINVGYFARALAFPTLYAFGIGSYIFYYWFFYTNGILMLFKGHGFKVDFKFIIGNILFFASTSMLITLIQTKDVPLGDNFYELYNLIYTGVEKGQMGMRGGYFNIDFINMFSEYPVGGGIVGYALVGLCNHYINITVTWIITVVGLIITYLLLFIKPTISLVKWIKKKIKGTETDSPKTEKKENKKKQTKKEPATTNENKDKDK
jgi:hypothetical protein